MTEPAILLLHAFPLDPRMWDTTRALLADRWRVVAPELPGRAIAGEPSLDAVADAVAEDLRGAGLTRVVVAGLSMGGYVGLALLERHPDLVAGLALCDTKSTADAPEAHANRLRVAAQVEVTGTVDPVRAMTGTLLGETTRSSSPAVVRQVAAWVDEQDPARVAWSQRAMAGRPDRTDVLASFAGPVTVLVGDEDTATPVAAAQHMAAAARHAVLVVVPRAGHLSAVEDPAAVADALADLVARVV